MAKKLVYLTAPFAPQEDDDDQITSLFTVDAALMARGVHTVTPLAKYFVSKHQEGAGGWEDLKEYSLNLMDRCDALYVIKGDGWETADNVKDEIQYAKDNRLQIVYLSPEGQTVGVQNP